ncbi:class I SAM-dependent methyltransferase [Nocardia pseudobrasiliensis]|uniref:class I SAM-dependent methyltransferase n=1 Tax=Nocardia pseudobrasiliensis TaxID=45979 RepID=UPI00082EF1FA|nr:class I SAM-dependent methyltransferase [Nocardia pseudobrasiliensis]
MTEHHPHPVLRRLTDRHDYLPAFGIDALLPAYDLLTRLLGAPQLHRRLIDQAELAPGHRILEIGCGTGNLTVMAARSQPAAEVIGSDPDPKALLRAQRKINGRSGIRFERAYAQDLPYADGEYDRVLSALMLHHLPADTRAAAAAEALRVLRPGGRLHLVDIGGDEIAETLTAAGFDCALVASEHRRRLGRVAYYRAERPA